ncbi:MAG: lysine exporter LysO family protein [Firmicutes bacterium]|nr:lysine exporter LysO family protein [Bacillota bacterium]
MWYPGMRPRPWLRVLVGPIPSLEPGGATNMDVQIPIIARGVGREYVPLAFFSGVVLALSEAALIIFFISI